jgi:type II secretory pathway component PulJ
MMPQLVVLALVAAGLYAGYRWLTRPAREIAAEVRRTEDELRARAAGGAIEKDMGRLEYDPVSGVYRPTRRS